MLSLRFHRCILPPLGLTINLPHLPPRPYRLLELEPCPDDEEEEPWPFFEPEVL